MPLIVDRFCRLHLCGEVVGLESSDPDFEFQPSVHRKTKNKMRNYYRNKVIIHVIQFTIDMFCQNIQEHPGISTNPKKKKEAPKARRGFRPRSTNRNHRNARNRIRRRNGLHKVLPGDVRVRSAVITCHQKPQENEVIGSLLFKASLLKPYLLVV